MHSKAVFFDVDDTLYDHLAPFREAVQAVANPDPSFPYEEAYHLMRYYSDQLSLELGGAGTSEYAEALEKLRTRRFQLTLEKWGIILSDRDAQSMQADYLARQYQIHMFEGAPALIQHLTQTGHVVGLITNGPLEHQMNKVTAMKLEEMIPSEHIFVSGGVGWDKPDPRIFAHVNEVTNTTPEHSIYVGDSWRNDVVGALAAGWQVIWFNHRGVEPESQHVPQHTADSFEEVDHIIRSLV
ncbi:HAD family hydrolase [Paenibacillus lemnae]|uniref:HAD family hydrolase n=1 Tax=Paenibacillus lemnae TaxID=1330551 RepID=A0A848M1K0_PAELE|nr:HAD family hydrolase [Paenibacillus lemnae]NMO94426.1 HAD family hydrolase [Paenibacillus lemnae]